MVTHHCFNQIFAFYYADVRLKRFADEKSSLKAEVQLLTGQLEEMRAQRRSGTTNGTLGDEEYEEAQSMSYRLTQKTATYSFRLFVYCLAAGEANKQLADYRYKLQRAEQEIAGLQSSLARSETQVIRFKSSADASEKAETDLKGERRKLQREVRAVRVLLSYNCVGVVHSNLFPTCAAFSHLLSCGMSVTCSRENCAQFAHLDVAGRANPASRPDKTNSEDRSYSCRVRVLYRVRTVSRSRSRLRLRSPSAHVSCVILCVICAISCLGLGGWTQRLVWFWLGHSHQFLDVLGIQKTIYMSIMSVPDKRPPLVYEIIVQFPMTCR